jgi:hypothetical protein
MTRPRNKTQYLVVRHEGRWCVSRHGKLFGPYDTQAAAIRSAIDAAQASSLNDRHSQVLTRDANGTVRVEWTYGADPYPPPA